MSFGHAAAALRMQIPRSRDDFPGQLPSRAFTIWTGEKKAPRMDRRLDSQKVVLMRLADQAREDTGLAWPGQRYLRETTGLSNGALNDSLRLLEKKGLVKRVKGNSNRSTQYQLMFSPADENIGFQNKFITAAWNCGGMEFTCKLVLMVLAYHVNENGVCWPSGPTIAAEANMHEKTLVEIVGWLRGKGLIEVAAGGNEGRLTQTYTLHLNNMVEMAIPRQSPGKARAKPRLSHDTNEGGNSGGVRGSSGGVCGGNSGGVRGSSGGDQSSGNHQERIINEPLRQLPQARECGCSQNSDNDQTSALPSFATAESCSPQKKKGARWWHLHKIIVEEVYGVGAALGKSEGAKVGMVLNELLDCRPDLTERIIRVAAEEFRSRWPTATLTATALTNNWSHLIPPPRVERAISSEVLSEPAFDWRAIAAVIYDGNEAKQARWAQMTWAQVPGDVRVEIGQRAAAESANGPPLWRDVCDDIFGSGCSGGFEGWGAVDPTSQNQIRAYLAEGAPPGWRAAYEVICEALPPRSWRSLPESMQSEIETELSKKKKGAAAQAEPVVSVEQ